LGAKAGHVENRWPEILASATENLSTQEQVALLTALVKLIRSLQLQGEIQVARMCVSCEHFRSHAHEDPQSPHHCGFYDTAFGDESFRLDCPEYVEASLEETHPGGNASEPVKVAQSARA
jgi:hypothetical protein